ncbi:MAG TPA: MmgE/PrpD family protein [Alphaproteobacteria bacterium]|nr:MmgE/PrpD family protein [Alphaproteobacteria bacterium]
MKSGTIGFIRSLRFSDLPREVADQARVCVLDLVATACGGLGTKLSRIIRDHAVEQFGNGSRSARLMFDGRRASPVGAALANGMTIDAFDAHDGHVLTKGHAGAAVLPAALAFADIAEELLSGRDFMTDIVVGYEVAIRAGIATHRTACDYHTSGSWNALGAAAIGARRLGLDASGVREALGIAEYHGPRSQMMRCIDSPTMVKDGSGWGAMTGVSAALLAASGFTGAPALVVESEQVGDLWADLGQRWRMLEMYFKPYPVCRWAQPAVEAALALVRQYGIRADEIATVEVATFHEAVRLAARTPRTTEEAQYSLPHPVAAAIVRGRLAGDELGDAAFTDPEIRRLSAGMALRERGDFNGRFPAERYAQVSFVLRDGRRLDSADTTTRGDPSTPLPPDVLYTKFRDLADPVLGRERREGIERAVDALIEPSVRAGGLIELLTTAP